MEPSKEKELIEKAAEVNQAIKDENIEVMRKMLIIACSLQVAREGLDDLTGYSIFKQEIKKRVNSFERFLKKEVTSVVDLAYHLDEEMSSALVAALENYITGLCTADPAEIIGRYLNADK